MPGKTYRRTLILLSGGVGARIGGNTPKQYLAVGGRSILEHTLYRMKCWNEMDSLVIVADTSWQDYAKDVVEKVFADSGVSFLGFALPGENRQLSILNAITLLRDQMAEDAYVLIHDAVRPEVSEELIGKITSAMETGDGVMPYLPMKDTIYLKSEGDEIESNLNRDRLVAGQTPEAFDYHKYLKANESLSREEILAVRGSTEPAVSAGMKMVLVPGEESNYKITTKEDFERFRKSKEGK
jgi:2-C-methyl-D-erythritol 4-phosphate cytidylyltransferase